MSAPLPARLARLGDDLERAVAADIAGPVRARRGLRPRSRGGVVAAVTGAVVLVGGGAAGAVVLLGPHDVAAGMPAGSMAFAGVVPVCETTDGASTLRCTVAGGVTSTEVVDWTGTIETFDDPDGDVAGACRSEDARGTAWICFTGQKAVTEHLIGAGLLGAHSESPGVG